MTTFKKLCLKRDRSGIGSVVIIVGLLSLLPNTTLAHIPPVEWRVTVNSSADTIAPDGELTLREAIAFLNGTLSRADLSPRERLQLSWQGEVQSRIQFELPSEQTTIYLQSPLPELQRVNLVVDGTSQMQRQVDASGTEKLTPLVMLTPALNVAVPRGLTVVADGIRVQGLSIYGFNQPHTATAGTLVANLVVSHPFAPPTATQTVDTPYYFPFRDSDRAPQNVVLASNWIGQAPETTPETVTSAHGIYVLNAENLRIENNLIAHHQGAGIITGFRALKTTIERNVLEANGTAGIPDGIRLEGNIEGTTIAENLIYRSGGSGIYLFKPAGAIVVRDNVLSDNGQRYQRAGIYVTGSNHHFDDNWIGNQPGPGIVVGAVPHSEGVQMRRNQFVNLQGLSIDLVAQSATGVHDYQQGDGRNPSLNHHHRRRESANYGINAPQFAHPFLMQLPSGNVAIVGTADPGSKVELYRVDAGGNLAEPLLILPVNEQGKFEMTITELEPNDRISAIASHPIHGTSEPAAIVEIRGWNPEDG